MHYSINGNLLVVGPKCYGGKINDALDNRGNIECLTDSSVRRMCHFLRGSACEYQYFGTLTYPDDKQTWYDFKRHFKNFVESLRRDGLLRNESGQGLFWFLEFQKRGAPHFHFYSTFRISTKYLSQVWFRCVDSDDERHLKAGTNIRRLKGRDHARRYAKKYASKISQKKVPDMYKTEEFREKGFSVGRFWGIVGDRSTLSADIELKTTSNDGVIDNDDFKLERLIYEEISKNSPNSFNWDCFRCYEFANVAQARVILDAIRKHADSKWQQLSATV